MSMPNFIVVGVPKAGTTSLYTYLQQHPDIYLSPVKETNFFMLSGQKPHYQGPGDANKINRTSVYDLAHYTALFQAAKPEQVCGEISPLYLYSKTAAKKIAQDAPEAKLLMILRNPTSRAYSNYLHLRRDGREPEENFLTALTQEEERIQKNWSPFWHYHSVGFYGEQIDRFLQYFPREQMRFYLYEDLLKNPSGLLADIFSYLGVAADFQPNTELQKNVSGLPKSQNLHQLMTKPHFVKQAVRALLPTSFQGKLRLLANKIRTQNLAKPEISQDAHQFLVDAYTNDVTHLGKILNRDLSHWLK